MECNATLAGKLFLLVLALLAMGWSGMSLVTGLSARKAASGDRLILVLVWGPLSLSLLSLLLADAGLFSARNLGLGVALWCGAGAAVFAVSIRRQRETCESGTGDVRALLALVAVFAIAGTVLFSRPFQYLYGGWDPGEYVSTAQNIARTGSLEIHDALLPSLSEQDRTIFYHEPSNARRTLQAGYLVVDAAQGRIVPDYFHLYPAWLAVFAEWLGLNGTYLGQTVIAVLSLIMFALAVRVLFGGPASWIAALVLLISPAQIYFARFTTAEMLTQFLLSGAFFALARSIERPHWGYEITAGAALGAAFLAHSTTILPCVGILAFLLFRAGSAANTKALRLFWVVALCFAAAFVRNLAGTPVMMQFLFSFMSRRAGQLVPALALVVGAAIAAVILSRRAGERAQAAGGSWQNRWLPATFVALAGAGLYFVRPVLFLGPEARNLPLLGLLISPILLVACFGFFFTRRWSEWTGPQALFLIAGGVTCSVLLINKMVAPVYMWGIRRYVPIVLPFAVALAAATVAWLMSGTLWRRIGGVIVVLAGCAYLAHASWPVVKITEYAGLPSLLSRVAKPMTGADLVLCDHWTRATPLRYAFGLPAYQLSRQDRSEGLPDIRRGTQLLRRWLREGQEIYWLGGWFADPEFQLQSVTTERASFRLLAQTTRLLPRFSIERRETVRVYRLAQITLADAAESPPCVIDIGYDGFGLIEGFHGAAADGDITCRWTSGKGRLYVPTFGAARDGLWTIRLAHKRPHVATVKVGLLVGQERVAELDVGQDWKEYTFTIPARLASAPAVELRIESEVWTPADQGISGYPRDLGVCVDWLRGVPSG